MLNLNEMSSAELKKLAVEVQDALKIAESTERRKAYEAAKEAAAKLGYSLSDIIPKAGGSSVTVRPKKPAKYKNPKNATQTWSGSGRQPFWFKDALQAGVDPSNMEI